MIRFDDLDRALSTYLEVEAAAPASAGLLENAMQNTARRRPRPAWLARIHAGTIPTPRGETARTLLIAAALVGLLLLIVGFALMGGGRKTTPLLGDATATPQATATATPRASASVAPLAGGPLDEAYRATWIATTRALPGLGTGAGPVSMTIAADGTKLSAANVAPGATFDSTITALDDERVRVVLDRQSGGCDAGFVGEYRWQLSDDGSQLTLTGVDDCATRAEALARTWGRSLVGPTSIGSGFVATMNPQFRVSLPDQPLSSRILDDFFEIGGSTGFGFDVFKNPQGFVDPCSTDEARVTYTPGAAAFADFLEQNPALDTISREELTVGGNRAIHIVTVGKTDYAACRNPPDGFYLWTPKDCLCHFVVGPAGRDSLYLVEVGADTFMFEVLPVDETDPIERQVIESIEIPANLPGG